ncbi:MAG: hypothetical protein GXP29_12700 [Planctomycetes bacterium]|nr:hypothetical protein [Planctomycetota bacterium]
MLDPLLRGVFAPAVVVIVMMVVGHRIWRNRGDRKAEFLPAIAIGLGVSVSYVALFGWTKVPPAEHWQWTFVLIGIATLASILTPHLSRRPAAGAIVWIIIAALSSWLIVPSWEAFEATRLQWHGAVAMLVFANLAATSRLNQKNDGLLPLLLLCIAAGFGSVVAGLAHTAKLAQLCGALATTLGVLWIVGSLKRKRGHVIGIGAIPSVMLPACALLAYFYESSGEFHPTAFVICGALPFVVGAAVRVSGKRLAGWKRVVILSLITAIPGAIAVILVVLASQGDDPYAY